MSILWSKFETRRAAILLPLQLQVAVKVVQLTRKYESFELWAMNQSERQQDVLDGALGWLCMSSINDAHSHVCVAPEPQHSRAKEESVC